jgi:hypothetical protein
MMYKRYLFILLISALVPIEMMAGWVPVSKNSTPNSSPLVELISDNQQSTVIRIDVPGFNVNELIAGGKSYQNVDLLSEIFTMKAGYPELPYVARVLAVPDQAGISVEVIETGEVLTFRDIYLPPARPGWYEGQPEPAYLENAEVYQSDNLYPNVYAEAEPPAVFRDFRVARISVYPVRYNAAKKELQVVSSITIKVNYGKGEVINPKTTPKKAIAPSFGKIYRSFIFNYEDVLNTFYGGKEEQHELMLCIMPDEFATSFQTYADWKRQSGTDIHVTKFSDIGANATNPDIIKNHIADAYNNWDNPPTYVLLVGDDGVFPKKIVNYPDYSFPNEDYFVEIEGNDYFPEMMVGRFTNEADYGMQVMINKFMLYEKNPYTAQTSWFKKATCCANNEYVSSVETKRFTAQVMLEDGNFTSVDTLMSDGNEWGYGCTVDLNDIITAINNGRSYLNYRGEGWDDGWHATCYEFTPSDVSGLANGQKFTFITSIGCGVAMFNSSNGNCFGETWIELGSLTSPRGGVAFVGPTSNTHTTNNNKIDKGIYTGMFREGMDTPGEALLRGKLYMYHVFGNDYYVEYHYKIYCILGDPSIHIWKDVPLAIDVDHVTTISTGMNQLEFTVTHTSSGDPVPNAELCLSGNDIFVTGISDAEGKVNLDITPLLQETLKVTVRGGNVIPYQGTITVTQEQQTVEPIGDPALAELTGNMDGQTNPNENFNALITLKNWGSQAANGVSVTLTTTTSDFLQIITTTPVSFGNIAPGGTFTGNPFQFFIKPECPVGQPVTLKFHIVSSSNSWDYFYDFDIVGCDLTYKNTLVNDLGLPSANFRLETGENVRLIFTIENNGVDAAPDVMGILSCNDPYITVEDSVATFGNMAIGSEAINYENNFEVTVSSSCPAQHLANCSLKLFTQNGNYPYVNISEIQLPVSLSVPTDYTGPDAYGYYAYSSTDPFYDQSPVFNWFELAGIGTAINVPDTSDYTQTVTLPFSFKYYGTNYTTLRISTDGWIAPGSGSQTDPINNVLPFNDNVNCMVAPFWSDLLHREALSGEIFYYNDAANHRFIVEWDSIGHNLAPIEEYREVFQVMLLDPTYFPTPTGDGEIVFQYKVVESPDTMTIGIENQSQNVGLLYVYNSNFNPTASEISNNHAIKFTTKSPTVNSIITGVPGEDSNEPGANSGFILDQNRPNPFSNFTLINFSLPVQSTVRLEVYNINGELVRTLLDKQQSAGSHSIEWNGMNNFGNPVTSGVYFYRIQTDGSVQTRKMFMLK